MFRNNRTIVKVFIWFVVLMLVMSIAIAIIPALG